MFNEFENSFDARDLSEECEHCDGGCGCDYCHGNADDGQPDEYTEWQDYMGGDDWDHGQYDHGDYDY